MNYRHAFHAGNFADVVKHAVLVRILVHLRAKPAAFRVIDTHAGAGLYDLRRSGGGAAAANGERASTGSSPQRSGERRARCLRPISTRSPRFNGAGRLTTYPGSPALVRAFLRPQDRLVACELEPKAAAALARNLAGDRRSKAVAIDGWTALNAYVPPKERRGLVLIDPSFEDAGDFPRLAQALEAAHRKWAGGTYLSWYPIKERAAPDALARRLRRTGIAKVLRAELTVARAHAIPPGSAACGLIVVNPPWTLAGELQILLPELAAALSARRAAPTASIGSPAKSSFSHFSTALD